MTVAEHLTTTTITTTTTLSTVSPIDGSHPLSSTHPNYNDHHPSGGIITAVPSSPTPQDGDGKFNSSGSRKQNISASLPNVDDMFQLPGSCFPSKPLPQQKDSMVKPSDNTSISTSKDNPVKSSAVNVKDNNNTGKDNFFEPSDLSTEISSPSTHPVSYTHLPSPRDKRQSRMPSSA